MIVDSSVIAASENLRFTYLELAKAANAARIWREHGFQACVGPFPHPICNFASDLDLDFVSAGQLADLAASRESFHVYNLPSDRPSDCARLLRDAGFQPAYDLVQMVAFGRQEPAELTLERADSFSQRSQVSLFMVEQFFQKQTLPFRRRVADATARATSLELLSLKRGNRILGAAMICFRPGMAGIYNLCVDSECRGVGIGAGIVREVLRVCGMKGAAATLQCDARLETWYERLGFRKCGDVRVFNYPRSITLL